MNCSNKQKYEITVKDGKEDQEKEYTIYTDGNYTKIDEPNTYLYAKIDSDDFIVGLAE